MKTGKQNRGSQPAIPVELWPELQGLERAGKTLAEIKVWLLEHQVEASVPTISRVLARIRLEAPAPIPAAPQLAAATEDDDLAVVRAAAREDMKEGEWRKRHSAWGALLRVAEIRRKVQPAPPPHPPESTSLAAVAAPASAAPALTPEQEEEQARRQLGKMN